jgi:hypothetical protein
MKPVSLAVSSLVLVLLCARATASGPEGGTKLDLLASAPSDLRVTRNVALPSNYPNTECVDVSMKRSRVKVGFICSTTNKDFINDMGISAVGTPPSGSRPEDRPGYGLTVSTPMGQHEMRPGNLGAGVSSAEVDCDTVGAAIYRATATCHIAITPLESPQVVYSNFVLNDHVAKKRGISQERITGLWRLLAKP